MGIACQFTLGGRKAWNAASAAIRKANADAIHVRVRGDFAIIYAYDDTADTRNVTTSVPVSNTTDGQFAIPLSHIENIIGKRNDDITFSIDTDGMMSFSSGKFQGKDILTLPWNPDVDESCFVMPSLSAPTFDVASQEQVISAIRLAALKGLDSPAHADVQVEGKGGKIIVGTVTNSRVCVSSIKGDYEGSFLLPEDVVPIIAGLGKEPFSLKSTPSAIVVQTENATISVPTTGGDVGKTLEDAKPILTVPGKFTSTLDCSALRGALSEQAFLFEPNTPTHLTLDPDSVDVTISGDIGKLESSVEASGTSNGDVPESSVRFGVRGADLLGLLSHVGKESSLTIDTLDYGVRFAFSSKTGTKTRFILHYYE